MTAALLIGERRWEGWTSASVVRSLETAAGIFRFAMSDRSPRSGAPRPVRPGAPVRVALDGETVISGYIDDVEPSYDADSHAISIAGRDAAGDLVDCSVARNPVEWRDADLLTVATALAAPFGIPVRAEADVGAPFRTFRTDEGEAAWEAISRACRMRAVLPQSDGRGGLVLALAARTRAGVRLARGTNILSARGKFSLADRYSDYALLGQQAGADFLTGEQAAHVSATASDPGVGRYRPLTVNAEQGLDDAEAETRIQWEASFRAARARRAEVTVQGWRETPDGPLWAPGRLVEVSCDWLGIDGDMLVAGVRQSIGEDGTLTTLSLALPGAFDQRLEPEPAAASGGFWE